MRTASRVDCIASSTGPIFPQELLAACIQAEEASAQSAAQCLSLRLKFREGCFRSCLAPSLCLALSACLEELHRQRGLQLDFPSPFTARRHRLLDPDAGDVALSPTAEHDSPPESAEEVKNLIAGKVSNKATRDWQ